MTPAERLILSFFGNYQAGPGQMVFFQPGACKLPMHSFKVGMESLIDQQMVMKERPKHAYSLTHRGYQQSMAETRAAASSS